MDDTGTTLAGITANMRPGEPQVIAQYINQQIARFNLQCVFAAIDCQRNCLFHRFRAIGISNNATLTAHDSIIQL